MELEVRHLKLVEAIAELGGLTRAGTRLHLSQSALSHQLRDAEEKLGTQLFHRMGKRMILTQAGERVLQSARFVLEEMERAETDIRRTSQGREGLLRIATECYTCYHWLPGRLKKFQMKYPRVEMQVIVEATRDPIPFLLEGKLDLAIVHQPVHDRRLQMRSLFDDELLVVMPPGHPLVGRPFLRAQDLADQHLILYDVPKEESMIFRDVLMPAGVQPRRVSRVQLTEAIVEMVKAGLGISVLPGWVVAPYFRAKELRGAPLTRSGVFREWSAATMRKSRQPSYVQDFVDLLAADPLRSLRATNARRVANIA
ncbi:MAG: LysR family transcriptional regulator [Acidobacteria bacterium]|nr:LysR family transcriptional regulator [Acidobacteriota bacterium]